MNITKETECYVQQHAGVKDSLKKGIINYSKLARNIIDDRGLKRNDFEAIVVALRRFERKIEKKISFERNINELLRGTSLDIGSKILVCVLEPGIPFSNMLLLQKEIKKDNGTVNFIEGVSAITLITLQKFEPQVDKYFKQFIVKKRKNVVEIILKSSEKLENTPGVVAYLYSLFADNEINILETMSCWTDTIFIVEEKDLNRCIELLNFR